MRHGCTGLLTLLFLVLILGAAPVPAIAQHDAKGGPSHGNGQQPSGGTLDDIVVIEQRIADYIENNPQQVTVLERAEIEEGNFLDVGQALDSMPGVDVRDSGSGMGARIAIRGSGGGGGILVLVNGRPAGGGQYGGVELSSIPLTMVKRIEVFKPPVPVWLGPGATHGAINILLETEDTAGNGEKKRPSARVGVYSGSFGKIGGNVSKQFNGDTQRLRLAASASHMDGRRVNSDRDQGSAAFHWDIHPDRPTRMDINGRYYLSRHGSPGRTDNPTPDTRQDYDKGSFDARIRGFMGENGSYEAKAFLDAVRLEDESRTGLVAVLETVTPGIRAESSWAADDGAWGFRLTAIAEQDFVDHTLTGDHRRDRLSLGQQTDREWGPLHLTVGARGDYTSDFDLDPAGNIGLGFKVNDRTLVKANAGYTVNVPSFGQLYQQSHGSIDQVRGNPDLAEEKISDYSFGLIHEVRKDRVFEASLFYKKTEDDIVYDDFPDLIKRPVNIDESERLGIETAVKWAFTATVSADVSYVFQNTKNKENDLDLTYSPEHSLKLTGKWSIGPTRLEAALRAYSEQFSDTANAENKKVAAYATVDAKITRSFETRAGALEVFAHVENLLDETFESHFGYPDDGIRFTIGANLGF